MPTLAEIERAAALVHRVLLPTPQLCWPLLSARCGAEMWVKHENHTPIGAFKLRGGLAHLAARHCERSLIARWHAHPCMKMRAVRAGLRFLSGIAPTHRGHCEERDSATKQSPSGVAPILARDCRGALRAPRNDRPWFDSFRCAPFSWQPSNLHQESRLTAGDCFVALPAPRNDSC